jgi:hypothetical protein
VIQGIIVTVYCNGGFHPPETIRFVGERVTTAEIVAKLKSYGWTRARDGKTYCRDHRPGA